MIRQILPIFALIVFAAPLAAQSDAWLGIKAEVVEPADAKELGIAGGLKVTSVDAGSPAAEAEVETGDIILSADETAITTIEALQDVLADKGAGDKLNLAVRRMNGRNEPLIVTLGSKMDKSAEFAEDIKVSELRKKIRAKEAEKRALEKLLEERIRDLETNKAKVAKPEDDEKEPESTPKVVKPKKAKLTVTLGAGFRNLNAEQAKKAGVSAGVLVTSIKEDGAAAESGLKAGDVVVSVDGVEMAGTGDLRKVLAGKKAGDSLEIQVVRDGKEIKITATLRAK